MLDWILYCKGLKHAADSPLPDLFPLLPLPLLSQRCQSYLSHISLNCTQHRLTHQQLFPHSDCTENTNLLWGLAAHVEWDAMMCHNCCLLRTGFK